MLPFISLNNVDSDDNGNGGDNNVRGSVTSLGSRNQGAKSSDPRRQSTSSLRKSTIGPNNSMSKQQQCELAVDVGKALKRVDRSLFSEWTAWCVPHCLSFRVAVVLWDSFEPKACDVHSAAYSQVCDVFVVVFVVDVAVAIIAVLLLLLLLL